MPCSNGHSTKRQATFTEKDLIKWEFFPSLESFSASKNCHIRGSLSFRSLGGKGLLLKLFWGCVLNN